MPTVAQTTEVDVAQPIDVFSQIDPASETDTAWNLHPPGPRTYRQEVLADNPFIALPLDEAGGSFTDIGSRGLPVPFVSGTTQQPSLIGSSAGFSVASSGTGAIAATPEGVSQTNTTSGSLTLECWVYLPSGNVNGAFIKLGDSGWGVGIGSGNFDTPGRSLILIQEGVAWKPVGYSFPAVAGIYHVVVVRVGTTHYPFVNGVAVGTPQTFTPSVSANPRIGFGGYAAGTRYLSAGCRMDWAAIYLSAVPDARIAKHYEVGRRTAGTVGQASEIDTAGGFSLGLIQPVGQAGETDTASPLRAGLLTVFEVDVAQPLVVSNPPDQFSDPWVIAGESGTFTHDMTTSTLEPGEPNPNGATRTAWFQWTAPDSRAGLPTRFHSRGSDGDTTLAVYTGDTFGTLVEVAVSDDQSGDDADLRFNVVSGTTYRIQLGVKAGPATSSTITWLNGDAQPYDSFVTPMALESDFGREEFENTNGSIEVGEPTPAGAVATSWLSWTAETDNDATFTIRPVGSIPFTVRIYHGSPLGALSQILSATGTAEQSLTISPPVPGRTYWIQVSSEDDLGVYFEVSWLIDAIPEAPYPLPDPAPGSLTPVVPLHAFVYEADGTTLVTEVPRRMGVSLQEPLNTVGVGAMSVALSDPVMDVDDDLLRWGRVVKFYLAGKCIHGFQIRDRKTTYVSSEEFAGFIVTVGGPSVQFMLEDFIVRHDGKPRPDSPENRFYSWASKPGEWYDASDWQWNVNEWTMQNPPSAKKEKKPKNWRVKEARWINIDNAHGWRYFRKNWTNHVDGRMVRIFATADEWWRLYLDGEEIMSDDQYEIGYTTYKKYDTVLSRGTHTFAALSRGISTANKGDGNDSFLFAMCELDLDGKIIKPALLVSDSSWKAHGTNPPPGWNRAQVLRNVVKEARDRGIESAERLVFDFDGELDSEGKPWPKVQFNQEVAIGTSALNLQAMLSEGNGFDVWVHPETFKLKAWKRRGKNKSASIALEPGRNLMSWEVAEKDEALNKWLIRYDGGWAEYDAKGSQEDLGKRESYVSLGGVKDDNSAERLMKRVAEGIAKAQSKAGTGDIRKRPVDQPDGGLHGIKGAYPFLDFGVGDVVKAPNKRGRLKPMRLLSLSLSEDSNGTLSFDPELEEI